MKIKPWLYFAAFVLMSSIVFWFYPAKLTPALNSFSTSLGQFAMILPAIVLLMGIFSVLITPAMIEKNFGDKSGFYGNLKALVLGSLMSTGPFYLAFPMAKRLMDKGAKISGVIIFISAWNGIGIIAEIVEFHYMGPSFMLTRFMLNVVLIFLSGYVAEYLYKLIPEKK